MDGTIQARARSLPPPSITELFLGLFAAIAAGMVLSGIWFFFNAKNGGFYWRRGDWDDYKSTVLRRKGPDGRTLSNATKSTKLGGGSEAPHFTDSDPGSVAGREMREQRRGGNNNNGGGRGRGPDVRVADRVHDNPATGPRRHPARNDPELAAYKTEKAAKVGGMNSAPAGSHYDYSNTDRSEISSPAAPNRKERKERERREKARRKEAKAAAKAAKKNGGHGDGNGNSHAHAHARGPPSAAYSFTTGDDSSAYTAAPSSQQQHHQQHQHQHRYQHQADSSDASYYYTYRPGGLAAVPESHVPSRHASPAAKRYGGGGSSGESETGTKVYPCHIPGVSREREREREVGPGDSVSQVGGPAPVPGGGRRGAGGYRRGVVDV